MRTQCQERTYPSSSQSRVPLSTWLIRFEDYDDEPLAELCPPPLNFGFPATVRMGPHSKRMSTSRRSPTVGVGGFTATPTPTWGIRICVPKKTKILTSGTRATTRTLGRTMVRLGRGRHHPQAVGPVLSTGRVHTGAYKYGYTSQVPSPGIPFPSIFWPLFTSLQSAWSRNEPTPGSPFVVSFQLSIPPGR